MAMTYFRHLDWMSITVSSEVQWRKLFPVTDWTLDGAGRHGYKRKFVEKSTGIIAETDSNDKAMGTHFTCTGVPLEELRALGMTDDELVTAVEKFDGRTSRVDLTIDAWGCAFTPQSLDKDVKSKVARIPTRTYRLIDGHRRGIDGQTFETGAPTSDKRFRLYDKYAEKQIKSDDAWMRLELQLRRLYSRNAVKSAAENGVNAVIGGHIADYLKWENEEYKMLVEGESVSPEKVLRTDSNRQKWLLNQCAASLAKECIDDKYFMERFIVATRGFMEKGIDKR